jgi:hypothetical protein
MKIKKKTFKKPTFYNADYGGGSIFQYEKLKNECEWNFTCRCGKTFKEMNVLEHHVVYNCVK